MTPILSSVERNNLSLIHPKVPASKVHWDNVLENNRLTDADVDFSFNDQLIADATTNRNMANRTHRVEDSRITPRDEQTNKRNVQTKEVLLGGIQVTLANVNNCGTANDQGTMTSHDSNMKQGGKDPLLDHMQFRVASPPSEVIEPQQCNISSNIQISMERSPRSVKHHEEKPRQLSTSDPDAPSEKRSEPGEEKDPKQKTLQKQNGNEEGEISTSLHSIEKEYRSHAFPSRRNQWAVNRPVDVHLEDGVAEVTVEWQVSKVLHGACVGAELLKDIDKMGMEKYGEQWQTHFAHHPKRLGPRVAKAKRFRRKVNTGRKVPRITARQFSKL